MQKLYRQVFKVNVRKFEIKYRDGKCYLNSKKAGGDLGKFKTPPPPRLIFFKNAFFCILILS